MILLCMSRISLFIISECYYNVLPKINYICDYVNTYLFIGENVYHKITRTSFSSGCLKHMETAAGTDNTFKITL